MWHLFHTDSAIQAWGEQWTKLHCDVTGSTWLYVRWLTMAGGSRAPRPCSRRLAQLSVGTPPAGASLTCFFFPFYKIYHHLAYGHIGLLLFYMSICLLLLVKGQVICFTLGHSVFTMMWLGNPKEESHLRALCVGVERPPSSTGPVLCHPCPRMTSARLCGTSIMWAAVSLNENMDLRSFSYCDIFFSLWLNSWFFTKTWSIVLFRINKYVLFIVLKRNDFLFRIMIARRKVWRWPLSFHLFSGSSNVNIGIHGGRKRPSCSSLLTWCSFWWYCDWVFKRNLCSVWRDELV